MKSSESVTLSKTKSSIQAFLKTREQYSRHKRSSQKYSLKNLNHFSGGFAVESQVLDLPVLTNCNSQQSTSFEDVDNDFNYSQKIFHIADGNLYSIFSPIQGRNYGMKPSFLRKQKYTVQECHSRGRKNLRKGLKFHNFLPSESVTSEKSNGVVRSKWKVHSECRLREEHGTKQITISNWSQSVQNESENLPQSQSFNFNVPSTTENSSPKDILLLSSNKTIKNQDKDNNLKLKLKNNVPKPHLVEDLKELTTSEQKKQDFSKSTSSKKPSLKFVLNTLLDKPLVSENFICDLPDAHAKSSQSQKHRRKPMQTRRVVPYTKYLSILEEDDSSPLDLSSRCAREKCDSPSSEEEPAPAINKYAPRSENFSFLEKRKVVKSDKNLNLESATKSNLAPCNSDFFVNSSSLAQLLQTQIPPSLLLLSSPVNNALNIKSLSGTNAKLPETEAKREKHNFTVNQFKIKNSYPPPHANPGPSFSGFSNNAHNTVHKPFIKTSQTKLRRRSQRSVIKKNLEDTFRQNGFLVKTKQVSDGEATFCKFRQLRKYTRYYLKSWQQHLPDEVNKMWKGFLPPKTVLPSITGITETTNETH